MKHTKHEERKSFKKWAITGQLIWPIFVRRVFNPYKGFKKLSSKFIKSSV